MPDTSPVTYADWKAPTEDGQVILWPAGPEFLQQTRDNHAALASADQVRIQNVPLPELRTRQRAWIGHQNDDQLLFATGHQTELIHPGVWIKDALIHTAAEVTGGAGYHFAVDTDSPKHLHVRWPGATHPLTDDYSMSSADWSGLLATPSPEHLSRLARSFDDAAGDWPFTPLAGEFLSSMRRLSLESETLDAAMVNAMHEIDWKLGLRHHAMMASPLFQSEPYLVLVHHVLSRACSFSRDYNAALSAYRSDEGITNPGRPMPDLQMGDGWCEVPFWFDDLSTSTRQRARVKRHGEQCILHRDGGDEFVLNASRDGWEASADLLRWLRKHNLRLAPRALMLTTFLRLFIADQFVHGIGGGRYDQVTDKLIATHFNLNPPRFSVTTATLYFPTAMEQSKVCIPCLQQEGHKIRHRVLGDKKMELVAAINALPRKSLERSQQFHAMHHQLAAAASSEPVLAWRRRYEDAVTLRDEQQQVFDRELFYAIQPAERLQDLLNCCREALTS